MKFAEHLSKEQIRKFNQMRKSPKKKKAKIQQHKKEKLSERDLRDLMGMNRDTFERRRGAVRRR